MEDEERLRARILSLLGQQPGMRRGGSRIVALCGRALAVAIARSIPQCTVILLMGHEQRDSASAARVHYPANLEVLTCSLASAHFLPESLAAVIATQDSDSLWERNSNIETVADWLEPGGLLFLEGKPASLWRWLPLRVSGQSNGVIALAKAVGLRPDPAAAEQLQVFRKGGQPSYTVEPRDGSVAR